MCDKKISSKSVLVRHQDTHSDVRNFKCSICPEGRFFRLKQHLSQHIVFYYEPKFSCSHCNHKSLTSSELAKHINTHVKK